MRIVPLRAWGADKQALGEMPEAAPNRRRAAEIVEASVEGLYAFLYRLIATLGVVVSAKRPIRTLIIDRRKARSNYVYPFTFAAIGIFLVSIVSSVAGFWILDWIWYYEEIPRRLSERLGEGISLVTIAIGTFPAFFFMAFVAAALAPTLKTHRPRAGRALFITCYAVGTQAFFLFAAAVVIAVAQVVPGGVGETKLVPGWAATIFAGLLAAFIIGCLILAVIVPARIFLAGTARRSRRWHVRVVRAALAGLLALSVFLALPVVAGLPTIFHGWIDPPHTPTIELESDPVLRETPEGTVLVVDALLRNRGKSWLGVSSKDVEGSVRIGTEPLEASEARVVSMEVREVLDEAARPVSFTLIAPNSSQWRRFAFLVNETEDHDLLRQLHDDKSTYCTIASAKFDEHEYESVCVRRSFEFQKSAE